MISLGLQAFPFKFLGPQGRKIGVFTAARPVLTFSGFKNTTFRHYLGRYRPGYGRY